MTSEQPVQFSAVCKRQVIECVLPCRLQHTVTRFVKTFGALAGR